MSREERLVPLHGKLLQLSKEADSYPLADILTECSEGDVGLSNPVVDFSIDIDMNHS